jgi:hypothetical protein
LFNTTLQVRHPFLISLRFEDFIDEAMSWETVRNPARMPKLLLVIHNLCLSGGAPEEVIKNIEDVEDILSKVQEAVRQGEKF